MAGSLTDGDRAAALHARGLAALRAGRPAEARDALLQAVALFRSATDRRVFDALGDLAEACARMGDLGAARGALQAALAGRRRLFGVAHPAVARTQEALAALLSAAGDDEGAEACLREASAAHARAGKPDEAARLLARLGAACRARGALEAAEEAFRQALTIAPGLGAARHGLAAVLMRRGRVEEGRRHRDQALAEGGRVLVDEAPGKPAVLIPSLAEDGNIPLEHLFPAAAFTRIWWFFDGDMAEDLPPFNAVLVGAADADMVTDGALARLGDVLARRGKPVLNDPARVAATRRDRLPGLLNGMQGVAVPRVVRAEAGWKAARLREEAGGMVPPLLVRQAGRHGGASARRVENWDEAAAAMTEAGAWYVHAFTDTRGQDGLFRKYRAIFVKGRAYPYHLAISGDWLVHYFRAGMEQDAAKLSEEAAFLADPAAAIGEGAWRSVANLGRLLGLDYAGIDFSLSADRSLVVVWEANATMLVHPEEQCGALGFKNAAVGTIVDAFAAMLRDAAVPPAALQG